MKKRKISLNNPWFVTLISTMFGIVSGLYITSHFEKNRLYTAKEKALHQVESELKDNMSLVTELQEQLDTKYEQVDYLLSNLDENQELVISKDSLEVFKRKTAIVFEFEKAEPVSDSKIKLRGDFNFVLNVRLMGKKLSSIIWNSYKQTDYLSITNFECLTNVEGVYAMQEEVNIQISKWKDTLFQGKFLGDPEATEKFMDQWNSLFVKQKLLLEYYAIIDKVLADCK